MMPVSQPRELFFSEVRFQKEYFLCFNFQFLKYYYIIYVIDRKHLLSNTITYLLRSGLRQKSKCLIAQSEPIAVT